MKLINYKGAYITPLKINEIDWDLLPNVSVNALEYQDKELFWGQKTITGSQGDYDYYFRVAFNINGIPYIKLAGEEVSKNILKEASDFKLGRASVYSGRMPWNIGGEIKQLYEIIWFYSPSPAIEDDSIENYSLRGILDDVIEMTDVITRLQDEERLKNKTAGGAKVITLDALLKSFKKGGN